MPRRKVSYANAEILPDRGTMIGSGQQIHQSLMHEGKKSTAERVIYKTMDYITAKTSQKTAKVFKQAMKTSKPWWKSDPAAWAVPHTRCPWKWPKRRLSLSFRWVLEAAKARSGHSMVEKLGGELIEAGENSPKSSSIKKKEDTHKMAEANKAFAHYRW